MDANSYSRSNEHAHAPRPRQAHDEIREALAGIRKLYCENATKEQLLKALDRLARCTQAHFGAEEQRLRRQRSAQLEAQTAAHQNIIAYIGLVRQYVDRFDKFGLLQELHFLDFWLQTDDIEAAPPIPHGSRQRRLSSAAIGA